MGKFDKEILELEKLTNKVNTHEQRLLALEEAIDTSKEGFGILDEEGVFLLANDSYATLFGMTPEEMIGKSWETKYKNQSTIDYIHREILPKVNKYGTWSGIIKGETCGGIHITQIVTLTKFKNKISCHTRQVELFNME